MYLNELQEHQFQINYIMPQFEYYNADNDIYWIENKNCISGLLPPGLESLHVLIVIHVMIMMINKIICLSVLL
jgi:hypothetical protein